MFKRPKRVTVSEWTGYTRITKNICFCINISSTQYWLIIGPYVSARYSSLKPLLSAFIPPPLIHILLTADSCWSTTKPRVQPFPYEEPRSPLRIGSPAAEVTNQTNLLKRRGNLLKRYNSVFHWNWLLSQVLHFVYVINPSKRCVLIAGEQHSQSAFLQVRNCFSPSAVTPFLTEKKGMDLYS